MTAKMIEFSSAGLVVRAMHEGVAIPFAVRPPSMDPAKPWGAASTGPKFEDPFPGFLKERFGGDMENSKRNPGSLWDGRCRVPEGRMDEFVQWVCDQEMAPSALMNWNPYPELRRRLSCPFWEGVEPPLQPDEANQLRLVPYRFVRQPPTADGKVRLFKLYKLVGPPYLLFFLMGAGVALKLTLGDLGSTNGGSSLGRTAAGEILSTNLGLCIGTPPSPS